MNFDPQSALKRARELGFADAFYAPVIEYTRWIQAGGLQRTGLCTSAAELLPCARSVLILVLPARQGLPQPGKCAIDPYYTLQDELRLPTEALLTYLKDQGVSAVLGDHLPLKCAALSSGHGVRGKNDLYCHEIYGPLVKLNAIATDIPVEFGALPAQEPLCSGCDACLAACPVGALDSGHVDITKCLRNYMLSGYVPVELRKPMGTRLIGCDLCRTACPLAKEKRYTDRADCARDIRELLSCSPETLKALGELIGRNYARKGRIRAQAAIAAGNAGDPENIPALTELLSCDYAPARAHAAWALAELNAREILEALERALSAEKDEPARQDMKIAIERIKK